MAEANGEHPLPARTPSWRDKLRVLLYLPNVVDYIRIALTMVAFSMPNRQHPIPFACLYLLSFALDGLDGYLARRLKQVSAFGAFLDVALDNLVRSLMWSAALPGPLGALVPCVEWAVFVSTHAQGGAAWKTGCFMRAPAWVSAALAANFKSPQGILVIAGLHFLPLWLWVYTHAPTFALSRVWIGLLLLFGRLYCLAVELWVLSRHLDAILTSDALNGATHGGQQKSH